MTTTNSPFPCITVSNLTKRFASLVAVDDVSFEVRRGEIFGIAGPNGAGKTTLFNAVSGVPFRADSGTIIYEGARVESLAPHELYRLGMARTFQSARSFDSLSVWDNVSIAATFGPRRLRGGDRDRAVSEALETVRLQTLARSPASSLRLYEKKSLMLATAIVGRPKLLMLDEPGGGLSHAELGELLALVKQLNLGGLTIIVIEHVLPVLFGLSDRIMIMDAGRKIAEASPAAVARDPVVVEAYLGERGRQTLHAADD